jgi:hypothetical protein
MPPLENFPASPMRHLSLIIILPHGLQVFRCHLQSQGIKAISLVLHQGVLQTSVHGALGQCRGRPSAPSGVGGACRGPWPSVCGCWHDSVGWVVFPPRVFSLSLFSWSNSFGSDRGGDLAEASPGERTWTGDSERLDSRPSPLLRGRTPVPRRVRFEKTSMLTELWPLASSPLGIRIDSRDRR